MTYKKLNPWFFLYFTIIIATGICLGIGIYGFVSYTLLAASYRSYVPSFVETEYAWTIAPFSFGMIFPALIFFWHWFGARPELKREYLTALEQEIEDFKWNQFWKAKRLEYQGKDSDWDVL